MLRDTGAKIIGGFAPPPCYEYFQRIYKCQILKMSTCSLRVLKNSKKIPVKHAQYFLSKKILKNVFKTFHKKSKIYYPKFGLRLLGVQVLQ